MTTSRWLFEVFLISWVIHTMRAHRVVPSCPPEVTTCEFEFRIAYNWTMMQFTEDGWMLPLFVDDNGTFFSRRKDCSGVDQLPDEKRATLVTGDGSYKQVILINGQLPGPPIVVYEGQQVVVKLTSELDNEVTTLHWHGIEQRGTPWMDGAGSVSQCPVHGGQSFTHRFIASPSGTHWYHTHYGTQRTMGPAGALIVLERSRSQSEGHPKVKADFDGDFWMIVQDWMHNTSFSIYEYLRYDMMGLAGDYSRGADSCYSPTKQADGIDIGMTPFNTFIFNGKGRGKGQPLNSTLPLETFTITRGGRYRFRVISASMTYALRLSIDHHLLNVIGSDGSDVEVTQVESVIFNGGERFDFWIEARDQDLSGKYWIRAVTLEKFQRAEVIEPGEGRSILSYEGDAPSDPTTRRQHCTEIRPCVVLNCPFRNFPAEAHIKCVPITGLKSTESLPTLKAKPGKFTKFFLNFHFSGRKSLGSFKPNINGISHVQHTAPPQMYPLSKSRTKCSDACATDACLCTHELHLPLGHVIQMVLFIHLPPLDMEGVTGTPHAVHIHGHHFQVLKMGWPEYNSTTGLYQSNTPDLQCVQGPVCNAAQWTDAAWRDGHVPGLTQVGAPWKDTVIVPAGGYVVIRFLADNPGFWYLHCHTEYHNELGMSLVLREGQVKDMSAPPPGLPQCGDMDWSSQEFVERINQPKSPDFSAVPCDSTLSALRLTSYILASLLLILVIVALSLYYALRPQKHPADINDRTQPRGVVVEDKDEVFEQPENDPLLS